MKAKKEYVALAVIILLLLGYLLLRDRDKTHYELPQLKSVDKSQVTKLGISQGENVITLERKDEIWRIQPQGYRADQAIVDKMLDAAADFSLTTLVSESKNYPLYDLTDEKMIVVEVSAREEALLKFDIGKTASTYRHTFVRLDGIEHVYQAKGNIRNTFDTDVTKLRDKSVVKLSKDDVAALTIKIGADSLALQKTEASPLPMMEGEEGEVQEEPQSPWQTLEGKAADEKIVDRIINTLTNLKCDGYIDGKLKSDLSNPIYTLTVEGLEKVSLSIFAMEEDKYPAVSSQNEYPFYLPKWRAEQIMKKPAEILGEPAGE